ncbi:hypothetical protein K438DRAFT_1992210 [Mycena galopus ATCC 62051]|nr:hypothetical protein K438DRAFT_1992210 [Mycena galopus ATCC 62051]
MLMVDSGPSSMMWGLASGFTSLSLFSADNVIIFPDNQDAIDNSVVNAIGHPRGSSSSTFKRFNSMDKRTEIT